jgi:hypothetical protein
MVNYIPIGGANDRPAKGNNMYDEFWQTQARGTNDSEYQIYLSCADNGKGIDFTTGKPLKTYDEWLNS